MIYTIFTIYTIYTIYIYTIYIYIRHAFGISERASATALRSHLQALHLYEDDLEETDEQALARYEKQEMNMGFLSTWPTALELLSRLAVEGSGTLPRVGSK